MITICYSYISKQKLIPIVCQKNTYSRKLNVIDKCKRNRPILIDNQALSFNINSSYFSSNYFYLIQVLWLLISSNSWALDEDLSEQNEYKANDKKQQNNQKLDVIDLLKNYYGDVSAKVRLAISDELSNTLPTASALKMSSGIQLKIDYLSTILNNNSTPTRDKKYITDIQFMNFNFLHSNVLISNFKDIDIVLRNSKDIANILSALSELAMQNKDPVLDLMAINQKEFERDQTLSNDTYIQNALTNHVLSNREYQVSRRAKPELELQPQYVVIPSQT